MKRWVMLVVLVAVLAAPAQKLVCEVRINQDRARCWCKSDWPGGRWTTYPMLVCRVQGG